MTPLPDLLCVLAQESSLVDNEVEACKLLDIRLSHRLWCMKGFGLVVMVIVSSCEGLLTSSTRHYGKTQASVYELWSWLCGNFCCFRLEAQV